MGKWNTHGMSDIDEDVNDALEVLGLFPEELTELSAYARREAYVWHELAKIKKGPEKRKAHLIAGFWALRSQKWADLAVETEKLLTGEIEIPA